MEYFVYLERERLLVCRSCKVAVLKGAVSQHLQGKPHFYAKEDALKAKQDVSGLPALESITGRIATPDDCPPYACLGSPGSNGHRCLLEQCKHVAVDLRHIREHLRKGHGWVKQSQPGRRSAKFLEQDRKDEPWRGGVFYQRFFASGRGSNYFEVKEGAALRAQNRDLGEGIRLFMSKADKVRKEESEKIYEESDKSPNSWLRRLGAVPHLIHFSGQKEYLRSLAVLRLDPLAKEGTINEDDDSLELVFRAFERAMHAAARMANTNTTSWHTLIKLRKLSSNTPGGRPFHARFRPATMRMYTDVGKRFLAYVTRCMLCEDKEKRPPFKLTEQQQGAFETMLSEADLLLAQGNALLNGPEKVLEKRLDELAVHVVDFFISVLNHKLEGSEYQNVLVSFVCVLSIRDDGAWEGYENFTPKLSALMALARLTIIVSASNRRKALITEKVQGGMKRSDAEDACPSESRLIHDLVNEFMVESTDKSYTTPSLFLNGLRNFGMAAAKTTAREGVVQWDGDTLIYKGEIRIDLRGIQAMIQNPIREAEKLLYEKLLLCPGYQEQTPAELGLPEIPWLSMADSATDLTIGHSMVDTLLRTGGGETKGWIIKKISSDMQLGKSWFRYCSLGLDGEVDPAVARAYVQDAERFLELLLFIIHLAYGQPARGQEILFIRVKNTANGGLRNILMDRGLVMILIGYHKSFSRVDKEKPVHRFLPREVGVLLVYYLWLVLPFREDLEINVGGRNRTIVHLWQPDEADDGKVNRGGKGQETARLRRPKQPHQDSNSITPGGLDDEYEVESEPGDAEADGTPSNRMGSRLWTSDRMSRIMRRLSMASCGYKIGISAWRHIAVAFGRRYLKHQEALIHEIDARETRPLGGSDDEDDAVDAQASHGSDVAVMWYARQLHEGAFETQDKRNAFRRLSVEWHQLLGFASATEDLFKPSRLGKRSAALIQYDMAKELQADRWKALRRVSIEMEMTRMYGEGYKFRPGQRETLQAVMANVSPVVSVMGTGAGKSLCFFLPARSCPGGVTVVVVPLVSLLGNMMQRSRDSGVECAEWTPTGFVPLAGLVFVTPESALSKRFLTFLEGLRSMAKLDRVVIDECHTILEGSPKFRPKLRELGSLTLVGTQIVLLTATLKPTDEKELFQLLHVQESEIRLLRTSTSRPNIKYRQVTFHGTEKDEAARYDRVKEILDECIVKYPWPAKIIVYCRYKRETDAIAEALGCDAYHADVDSRDAKAARLQSWMGNTRREQYGGGSVMIATSAMGLGIDVGDVRVVLHIGMPLKLDDYSQQSGRAGRDREPSEAILLLEKSNGRTNGVETQRLAETWSTRPEDMFTSGSVCKRIVLDRVMDGRVNRDGCEPGEELCDYCEETNTRNRRALENDARGTNAVGGVEGSNEEPLEAEQRQWGAILEARRQRSGRLKAEAQIAYERLLINLKAGTNSCMLCRVLGEDDNHSMGPQHCPDEVVGAGYIEQVRREGDSLGRAMQVDGVMPKYSCCRFCLVPQEYCSMWEEDGNGGWIMQRGRSCTFPGTIVTVISLAVLYVRSALVPELRALGMPSSILGVEGELDGATFGLFASWLGRPAYGHKSVLNIHRVFNSIDPSSSQDGLGLGWHEINIERLNGDKSCAFVPPPFLRYVLCYSGLIVCRYWMSENGPVDGPQFNMVKKTDSK